MVIKVGLLGLGKTGRIIAESIFKDRRFELVFAVKKTAPRPIDYRYSVETREMLPQLIKKFKPNVIVDFTKPEATLENIRCLKHGTGIVIGTTGFTEEQLYELKKYGRKLKILYAPNISSGVNILMKVCKQIYELWKEADITVKEEHFKTKIDSPSGTAKKIAKLFRRKVPIHSVRAGNIIGVHEVLFVINNQRLTIKHESFSKEVFAEATKRAMLWLKHKRKGFFEIEEMYGYR